MTLIYEKAVEFMPAIGEIPPWIFYLILAILLTVLVLLVKILFFRTPKNSPYRLYKKDTVFDVPWTWEYKSKSPININCHCPDCGNELFYDEHRSGGPEGVEISLQCESCDRTVATLEGTFASLLKRVQGHIQRKIATGKWRE